MSIYELYSKRQSDANRSGQNDVYQYTEIPRHLRVQVEQIALESVGQTGISRQYNSSENGLWAEVEKIFLREKGLDDLEYSRFSGDRVLKFMRNATTEDWLDLFELIARAIHVADDQDEYEYKERWQVSVSAEDALKEINYRIRQAGVGYQFEENMLVRFDNQFVHAEITKPALFLLSGDEFEGPRNEFWVAHQHLRAGEHRQAISMAANALESTFKAIFDREGWTYNRGARISDLVKIAKQKCLWPDYLDKSFDQLVATLQSGLPKIRDNDASHGQGAKRQEVPAYVASYALHLAASKIVFISEASRERNEFHKDE